METFNKSCKQHQAKGVWDVILYRGLRLSLGCCGLLRSEKVDSGGYRESIPGMGGIPDIPGTPFMPFIPDIPFNPLIPDIAGIAGILWSEAVVVGYPVPVVAGE